MKNESTPLPATIVVDATTGFPLQGVASPELEAAAAAEDGLLFATELLGTWQHVPADPRVLRVHRELKREVRLVSIVRSAVSAA